MPRWHAEVVLLSGEAAPDGQATGAMGQLPLLDAAHPRAGRRRRRADPARGGGPAPGRPLRPRRALTPLGPHLLVIAGHRSDLPRAHPLRPLLTQIARRPVVRRIELAPLDDVRLACERGLLTITPPARTPR